MFPHADHDDVAFGPSVARRKRTLVVFRPDDDTASKQGEH